MIVIDLREEEELNTPNCPLCRRSVLFGVGEGQGEKDEVYYVSCGSSLLWFSFHRF